ncbi:MAG TPA: MogA/MoaB family molybdenum cofactor biosynthesis protein [Acidimicrobiales bacterium]|nr:MogA/MoaB family molybdenum cofactor biosynthesis protein [Acidimicrobiales bacterium]
MPPGAKTITVSDSVYREEREDRSGPAIIALLEQHGFDVLEHRLVPDGREPVATAIRDLAAGFAGAIFTTGGTGFAPTDQTPEGTQAVLERQAPGLAEAMRAINPLGRLSRGAAGTVGHSIVLNLPGSTAGAVECLEAVIDVLPHALDLLAGGSPH